MEANEDVQVKIRLIHFSHKGLKEKLMNQQLLCWLIFLFLQS